MKLRSMARLYGTKMDSLLHRSGGLLAKWPFTFEWRLAAGFDALQYLPKSLMRLLKQHSTQTYFCFQT